MNLIVTEKPSAARKFAEALGGMSGAFEGQDYRIVSLLGHVMTLDAPENQVDEALSQRYKKWSLDTLPWDVRALAFKRIITNKEIASNLKKALTQLDSDDEVIIATDVDPSGEGELLAWEILDELGWGKPRDKTYRMIFVDESAPSLQKAFRERHSYPIPSMLEDGDYVKADTRSKWDFMSMQFTRIATCVAASRGHRLVIRQGRLKSLMVHEVGSQHEAITNHKSIPYFEPRFKDEFGNVFKSPNEDDVRMSSIEEAEKIAAILSESGISEDSRQTKKTAPGKLLDLASIASILAAKGFKAQEILNTYQKMYEDEVVSYPRTEDKTITPKQFEELLPYIDAIADVVAINKTLLIDRSQRKTHVKEGGAHGANRPGINVPANLEALAKYGKAASAIYVLLAKNYLAMFAGDYVYEQVKGHVVDYPEYKGEVNIPKEAGFKAVFDADMSMAEEDGGNTEAKDFGDTAKLFICKGTNKKPQKPTMKWLTRRLEKYKVGTGATRTSTLADITSSSSNALMSENKGALSLTECGSLSYTLLKGCKIASAEVTEKLFEDMEKVGRFEQDPAKVLSGITDLVIHDCGQMQGNAKNLPQGKALANITLCTCPRCGKAIKAYKKIFTCESNKSEKRADGKFEQLEGCGFKLFRSIAGKDLSDAQAKLLIEQGKTKEISGFKKQNGETFNAILVLQKDATVKFGTNGSNMRPQKKR